MNKKIADKWVKALRSGKYKQGKSRLRTDNEYCCLGVLCDISKQGEWIKFKNTKNYRYASDKLGSNSPNFYAHLLSYILKWAKMRSAAGEFEGCSIALTGLNDGGRSFEAIATIIEENWEKL